ncbi:23S rRNA Gm-2251 2'-O-methyltransferase [Nitrosomonas ureae]|uniref:23S rRNA (guanosine-2'-O-)-methyltransferase RlmB n=1 Tax=Nitrosomonas ureae TaxID=44577 RepID=A0A286AFX2_9PROT|nr:23S rRNA (guanosine(2251)-2'-O)-methyltransferase RlmB [Nitrosomonas ureae]PXX14674.1 23S rRNA Gm-2251 2'-O-methyltransferase [Nitrosomonas ureae]SOD20781.1 23S rRNA Gm-2251 2'-O-methyltransferase [Nitrosomonas ureae]
MPSTRFIFGFHAVTSRLRQNPNSIKEIFIDATRTDQRAQELINLAENKKIHVISCTGSKLNSMSGNDRHQGIVANIDSVSNYVGIDDILDELTEPARLLVLDGIQDPHNLGACLRVADAFGVHAVIAPKDRAVGLTPTVYKVSSGAADTVPYISVTNLARTLKQLKEQGIWIIGTAEDAEHDLTHFRISGSVAWVFGSEEKGLRRLTRENCDQLVRIPMQGNIESLNVAVSAGICLFETHRQQSLG